MMQAQVPHTAVVTGASRGIGRAIALELARSGYAVVVHASHKSRSLHAVADEIRELGGLALTITADLTDPHQHEHLVDEAWAWRSGVDAWVNNAGVDVLTGDAAQWSFDRKLEALWHVDVTATIRLSRLTGARMKSGPGGSILNIGWDGAERGMEGDSGQLFAATKGAVMAFTRSLAQSLGPEVRVNCIAPGWVKTAWGENASEAWQQRVANESLKLRWGTPEDIAHVARFLVSPDADFINGQILDVNGGFRNSPRQ